MELQATPTINVLIEISAYVMAVVVLIHAWRQQPYFMFLMLSAMLFGFFVDYSAVSKLPAPYHYPQSFIALPGPAPLVVMIGLLGYLWPSLNILFPSAPNNINKTNNKPTEGDFCDQENN